MYKMWVVFKSLSDKYGGGLEDWKIRGFATTNTNYNRKK